MGILLNPYYVFSHVIFINPEKNFIMIELSVYRKIHALVFRGKTSHPKQRALLRKLLYNVYYDYFYNGIDVDHSMFNKSLDQIYKKSETIDFDHTTIVEETEGEAVIQDLEIYSAKNNSGSDKIWNEESQERRSVQQSLDMQPEFNSNIHAEINQLALQNSDYNLLVQFFGLGKILNMFRNITSFDQFRIKDQIEYDFIKTSLPIIAKYRLKYFDRSFDFICNDCNNIGKHYINIFQERKGTPGEIDSCQNTFWFDKSGIVEGQKHSTTLAITNENKIFKDMDTNYDDNLKEINIFSSRTSITIGKYDANQSTKDSLTDIIRGNHNMFKYIKAKEFVERKREESEAASRGIFAHILLIEDELKEIKELETKLENYFDLEYDKHLVSFTNMYLDMFKKQEDNNSSKDSDFRQNFAFGVNKFFR